MASSEWSERSISLAGIKLPIITAGSGRPLLVLNDEFGYPGWFKWQSALSRDHTLIIPMAPGFGRAPRIEWVESVRDLGCLYSRMLREEGLTDIDVVGFSFGAWVAAEMIASCPHQFRRAVLVAPGGIRPPVGELTDSFNYPANDFVRLTVLDPKATPEFSLLYGEPGPDQAERLDEARAQFARLAWQPYFHNPSLPYLLEGAGESQVLIIWGAQDKVVPRSAVEKYNQVVKGSKLVVFDNCGHRPEIEQSEKFVGELKNFLA
jgi:pimeloyl-ACP methyl ester carboxylesterase